MAYGFTDEDGSRLIGKYYLYKAIGNPGFIFPIYILYLLSHGLSYTEVGTIGAVQGVIVVVGEMPTGYIGDRIGRRNSMVLANVLFTVSAVGMILGETFPVFVLAFGMLSLGWTFVSGSEQAWLYDILGERLDEDTYTHVKGRGAAVGQWVMAATMIAGSLLYVVDPLYPFVAVLVARVLSVGIVFTLPQNAIYADRGDDDAEDDDGHLTVLEAVPIIREKLTGPTLRWFVLYMALFFGATMTIDAYIQPITVDVLRSSVGSALSAYGVPEAASIGFLYAAFTGVSALASDRASDVEEWLGVRQAVLFVPLATGAMIVAPIVLGVLAIPMFFVVKGSNSVLRPIVGQYLNDRLESVGRATVLSAVSMLYSTVRIPMTVGSGVLADFASPIVAVGVLGVAFVVVGGALFAWTSPVRPQPVSTGAEATSD